MNARVYIDRELLLRVYGRAGLAIATECTESPDTCGCDGHRDQRQTAAAIRQSLTRDGERERRTLRRQRLGIA